jgi:phosphomannomutase
MNALHAQAARWQADDPDSTTREALASLLAGGDATEAELADCFAGTLVFGTAGLRGLLGPGPNRMNRAMVA